MSVSDARRVVIAAEDPASPDAQRCLQAYFDELDRRFEGGFDAGRSIPATGTSWPSWRQSQEHGAATSRCPRSTTSPLRTTGSRRT